jgi:excisionase family DNA binding protein
MAPQTPEELLTYPQLAQRLKMTRRTIQDLLTARKIPVIRFNSRCVRFRWSEVEAAIAKLTVKAL